MKNWLALCACLIGLFPGLLLAQKPSEVAFARVERSVEIDDGLRITSLGGFGISEGKVGHLDLVYVESNGRGNTLGVELGGGLAFRAGVTLYVGVGALVGYDSKDDLVGTLYPELGAALHFTRTLGLIATGKLYANLKGDSEEVLLLGLLWVVA